VEERASYFKPGGTLSPDSLSYLTRKADDQIFQALALGEYVFVLDSRQKGKSSLIANAVVKLKGAGISTCKIDLQRLGANLTTDQWYAGLLQTIGQDLNLLEPLFEYWKSHQEVGPLSRWLGAIEHIALKQTKGRLIIFVDEIDFVQALKFSSDEFFAGIRACFNNRAENPEFERLSFCLVGVATPGQLIEGDEVTPFNIGRRIELKDFSREEIKPYEVALSSDGRVGIALLDRIYYWVSGHPYLTQLLASKVADDPLLKSSSDVDHLVHDLLISADARQKEPNLADVERRLLHPILSDIPRDEARSQVLDLYRRVHEKREISPNYEDPLVGCLLLSGVVNAEDGRLSIRNRVYSKLFDRKWCQSNVSDAEARRIFQAASRAAWRVGWVSLGVFAIIISLLGWVLYLAQQRDLALQQSRQLNAENVKMTYQASMILASKEASSGNWLQVGSLIDGQKDSPYRGWEWSYWNTVLSEPKILGFSIERNSDASPNYVWFENGAQCKIVGETFVVDGKQIGVVKSSLYRLWVFDHRSKEPLEQRIQRVNSLPPLPPVSALSRNLDSFLTISDRQKLEFKKISGALVWKADLPDPIINCGISTDEKMVFISLQSGIVTGFEVSTGRVAWTKSVGRNHGLNSSPDGSKILVLKDDQFGIILDARTGKTVSNLLGHVSNITYGSWFKDCSKVVTASADGTVCVWRVSDGQQVRKYVGFRDNVIQAVLTPDEKSVTCVLGSGIVTSVDLDERPIYEDLIAHTDQVQALQFSPNGKKFATASINGEVVLWDIKSRKALWNQRIGQLSEVVVPKFSPSGAKMLLPTAGHIRIVNSLSGVQERDVQVASLSYGGTEYLPDGRIITPLEESGLGIISADGSMKTIGIPGMSVIRVARNPSGTTIFAISNDLQIELIDAKSLKRVGHCKIESSRPKSLVCSPDGNWLAVGSYDSNVYLVNLKNDFQVTILSGHTNRVYFALFSPDSQRIVSTSPDTTARLFDVKSGRQLGVMRHGSWVSNANWSADGSRILTACDDGKVRIFDGYSASLLSEIESRKRTVFDARFTPNDKDLISVGFDKIVRYWHPLTQNAP
jgi:WD40 repeat protein